MMSPIRARLLVPARLVLASTLLLLLATAALMTASSAKAFKAITVDYPDPANVPARSVSDVKLTVTAALARQVTVHQSMWIPLSLQDNDQSFPLPEDDLRYAVSTGQGSSTVNHFVETVTCSAAPTGDLKGRCMLRVLLNSSISVGQTVDVTIKDFRHPAPAGSYRWYTYQGTDAYSPDIKHSSPVFQLVHGEVDRLWPGERPRYSARPGASFSSAISFRVADAHGNYERDPIGAGREVTLTLDPIEADSGIRFAGGATEQTVNTDAQSTVVVPEIVAGATEGRARLVASSPGLASGEALLIAGNPTPSEIRIEESPKVVPNGPALGTGSAPIRFDITVLDGDGLPYTPADAIADGFIHQWWSVDATMHDAGTSNFPSCVPQAEGDGWSCELSVGNWIPKTNEFHSKIDYVRDFRVTARFGRVSLQWDHTLSDYGWVYQGAAPVMELDIPEVFELSDTTALIGGPRVDLGWSPATVTVEYGKTDVDEKATAPLPLGDPLATPKPRVTPVMITGLEPGTIYLYRVVVENINGKAYSRTRYLITDPAPAPDLGGDDQGGGDRPPGPGSPGGGGGPSGQPSGPGQTGVRLSALRMVPASPTGGARRAKRPVAFALFRATGKTVVRMHLERRIVVRAAARRCRALKGQPAGRSGRCIRHRPVQRRKAVSRAGRNVIPVWSGRGARAVRPGRYRLRVTSRSGHRLVRTVVINKRGKVRTLPNGRRGKA